MTKVLITGSNGLLGQELLRLAITKNEYQVDALSARPDISGLSGMTFHVCDISNADELKHVFERSSPDIVINTAAMSNADQCEDDPESAVRVNVRAVENLAHLCRHHHAFFVHLSTDFVFSGNQGPYTEEDLPDPLSVYGQTKLEGEQAAMRIGKVAVVRTVLVYGEHPRMSRSNFVLWVRDSLRAGKEIRVVNDQFRTPTFVGDLASACLMIAEKRQSGLWHISGPEMVSVYDFAVKIAAYYQLNADLIKPVTGADLIEKAKRPARTGLVIERAIRNLDWKPFDILQGLSRLSR
jgi:dTDP-4-dehydrorhamnose reductase